MDDTLQQLLDAEMKAERLAKEAEEQHDQTIRAASAEARDLDDQFTGRIPEIQGAWITRSEDRAQKTIAEVERRYTERHERLRETAEAREEEALNAAFQILVDPRL